MTSRWAPGSNSINSNQCQIWLKISRKLKRVFETRILLKMLILWWTLTGLPKYMAIFYMEINLMRLWIQLCSLTLMVRRPYIWRFPGKIGKLSKGSFIYRIQLYSLTLYSIMILNFYWSITKNQFNWNPQILT